MRVTKLKLQQMTKGLLQLELAEAAHIERTRMNMLENGWLQPRADELARIAAVLGLAPEELTPAEVRPG